MSPLPFDPEGFEIVNVLHNADNALNLDSTNVPPLALGAGATYTGPATLWGSKNKLELVGSLDQAGTLYIDQSRDGGATWPAALTEQWLGAIGETFAFPTARAVGADAYRLRFTAGGIALAALVLAPYLTTGPVDHEKRLVSEKHTFIFGASHAFVIPIGARYATLRTSTVVNPTLPAKNTCAWVDGAAANSSWAMPYSSNFEENCVRQRVPDLLINNTRPVSLLYADSVVGGSDALVEWFA